MHQILRSSKRAAALAVAVLALTATACKDSAGLDDHEPEVETMRLTIAGQAPVNVSSNGTVTGTLTIPSGVATTITGEFLNAQGQPDSHVDGAEFQLSVNPSAGITFTRTGPFTGTLTGAAAGPVNVQFGLFHVPEAHNDFGPFTVAVTVTAPPVVVDGN